MIRKLMLATFLIFSLTILLIIWLIFTQHQGAALKTVTAVFVEVIVLLVIFLVEFKKDA